MSKMKSNPVRRSFRYAASVTLLLALMLAAMAASPVRKNMAAPVGQTITLRSCATNLYVSADQNRGAQAPLVAARATATTWEQFQVIDAGGGNVYLKALSNNLYVSTDLTLNAQVAANRAAASTWETYQWIDAGSYVELKSAANGNFVSVDLSQATYGPIYANRATAACWEQFTWAVVGAAPTATRTLTPVGPVNTPTRTNTPVLGTNLALNRPATSSSSETTALTPNLAVDGNTTTRWSSAYSDPQWIQVDLGSTATINRVVLRWEAAYANAYQIQTSNNTSTWTTIYSRTSGAGGVNDLSVSGSGRYVRMVGTTRATAYGYSLFEFEVYGTAGPVLTPTRTATPGGSVGNFPARFSAPYVETWNNTSVNGLANATGNKFYTLAFIIGDGTCRGAFNGDMPLSGNPYVTDVNNLRAQGGDVIISFGGASGTELGQACTSVSALQAAYQTVITKYNLKWMDLDIESGAESDTASVTRRNQALHNLQVANPGLHVSYTLAVDRSGLPQIQLNLLNNAKTNGVTVAVVNIMAMDYGPCYTDMGQAAIDAAVATRNQLSANGISAAVGVTPMLGVNDVTCENFTTANAQQLVTYANANSYISLLAYWAVGADPGNSYLNIFKTFH